MSEHSPVLWGNLIGSVPEIAEHFERLEQQAVERMRPVDGVGSRKMVVGAIVDAVAVRRKRWLIILEGMKYDSDDDSQYMM